MNADEIATWLAQGDNADEWSRLCDALALTDEFALFLALVPDAEAQSNIVALLAAEAKAEDRRVVHADALEAGADAPVRRFLAVDAEARAWLLLTTLAASRSDIEAFERCFLQLNMRRDQIVARVQRPMIVLLRPDARRRLVEVAPDLYSVHASQFRFGPGSRTPSLARVLGEALHAALQRRELDELLADIVAAEFERAASNYAAARERIEAGLGPHDQPSLDLLALGVELFATTAQPERARELANECWRRLRYVDEVRPETLAALAHFYAEHGPESRLAAVGQRWQQEFPARPWPWPARQAPA